LELQRVESDEPTDQKVQPEVPVEPVEADENAFQSSQPGALQSLRETGFGKPTPVTSGGVGANLSGAPVAPAGVAPAGETTSSRSNRNWRSAIKSSDTAGSWHQYAASRNGRFSSPR